VLIGDQPADRLDGLLVDEGADVDAVVLAAAEGERTHPLAELLGELLGDVGVHEEPVRGRAGLAHVAHLRDHRPVDRGVDVGVVEDQERRVAAELHADPLELVGGLLHQQPAHAGRAGEADLAQPVVGLERLAELAGVLGGHHVEHAGREAGLGEDPGQGQHRQGCLGGRLHHHGAAGGDRGTDLAGAHRQREVPRRDEQAGTHGLLDGQQPAAAGGGLHPAAVDPDRLLGVPPEELGAVRHLALGLLDRLAHLEAHQVAELVGALDDHLEGPAQDLPALARRGRRPVGLRGHRGVERLDRVGDRAVGHVRDDRAVGRVDHVEPRTVLRLAPGAADEEAPLVGAEEIESVHGASQARTSNQRQAPGPRGILWRSTPEGAL